MERKTIKVKVEKDEQENIFWNIKELNDLKIYLSDRETDDVVNFFNKIFEYIVQEEKLLNFEVDYDKKNAFYEITEEMLNNLNKEINSSEKNFEKIIFFKKNNNSTN